MIIKHKTFGIVFVCFIISILTFNACQNEGETPQEPVQVLIFGGGDHHDFDRWFHEEDRAIIERTGAEVTYTDNPDDVIPALDAIDILYMNTNQAIDIDEMPDRIIEFVEQGNGLLLVHASTWFIWDWPDYYRELIGGGSSSHGPLGEFDVYVSDATHPVMENVPAEFTIYDELYRFQRDDEGTDMHVLAIGIEPDTGDEYPVAWVTEHGDGRVVNITLGHDGRAHQHEAFIAMLENSIEWLMNN